VSHYRRITADVSRHAARRRERSIPRERKMSRDASGVRLVAGKRIVMYRAGRGRYQSGPTTVPRSMLTPDCQGESRSVRFIIIAPPYEA